MCWRKKQILISFRTPSLTQLIPEAPERPGGEGVKGRLSSLDSPQLCILPCP